MTESEYAGESHVADPLIATPIVSVSRIRSWLAVCYLGVHWNWTLQVTSYTTSRSFCPLLSPLVQTPD